MIPSRNIFNPGQTNSVMELRLVRQWGERASIVTAEVPFQETFGRACTPAHATRRNPSTCRSHWSSRFQLTKVRNRLKTVRYSRSGSPRIPYITSPNAVSVAGTMIASSVKKTAA